MKWVCTKCGGREWKIENATLYPKWKAYVKCKKCARRFLFTKYGRYLLGKGK